MMHAIRVWSSSMMVFASAGGCYDGDLDPSLDEVYACQSDSECALGSRCFDQVCRVVEDENEPTLLVTSPAMLQVFASDHGGALPVSLEGTRLKLASQVDGGVDSGYIDVLLDGALVDTITAGSLEDGIELDTVSMPSVPGLHHLTLIARRTNGEAFEGELARVGVGFWVDDGREQIGILSPPPGKRIPLGGDEPLSVEVVSLNFTMANPGYVSPSEFEDPGLGYVHLYLDATLPGCLPACNYEHQVALAPAGLSRVNRMEVEQPVRLPDEIGTVQVQIVAQSLSNAPYVRSAGPSDFVFHSVPVQSSVEVDP